MLLGGKRQSNELRISVAMRVRLLTPVAIRVRSLAHCSDGSGHAVRAITRIEVPLRPSFCR
jgi:hypothetical protein